jgi:hypothetical protein
MLSICQKLAIALNTLCLQAALFAQQSAALTPTLVTTAS